MSPNKMCDPDGSDIAMVSMRPKGERTGWKGIFALSSLPYSSVARTSTPHEARASGMSALIAAISFIAGKRHRSRRDCVLSPIHTPSRFDILRKCGVVKSAVRSLARALDNRDITVPIGQPKTRAIS